MSNKDNHGAGGASIKQLDGGERGADCKAAAGTAMLDASRGTLGPLLRIVGDGAVAAISDGDESITLGLLVRYGLVRAEVGQ